MKKIILYIAVSMDGFIAKKDGSVAWLDIPDHDNNDYGYSSFYEGIDTTLMGNKTYEQVLGFGVDFPYPTKKNYVFSRSEHPDTEYVSFVQGDILTFIEQLKQEKGKDIWLVGGGQLNSLFLKHHLIDEIIISVMPVVLGTGLTLFGDMEMEMSFDLKEVQSFKSGVVQMVYTKKS